MSGVSAWFARMRSEAQAERTDDSLRSMNWDVYEFLESVVKQSWPLPKQQDIDQLAEMPNRRWNNDIIRTESDIESVCMNTWGTFQDKIALGGEPLYDEPLLKLHKKHWDLMKRDKSGCPKTHEFTEYCRKANNAQNAADGDCYKAFALDLLSSYLTPEQRAKPKFEIDPSEISKEQHSWVHVVCRKNMGHLMVAKHISNRASRI